MRRRTGFRVAGGLVCMAVAMVGTAAPGFVAPPAGPALAPRDHSFMLYLSKPLGGGGSGSFRPKFGFRVDQVRMNNNSGAPDAGDPMQHRPLVNWQMDGLQGMRAADMHVVLGGRVSYDVTHAAFGSAASRSVMTLNSQGTASGRALNFSESKPFESQRAAEPLHLGRDSLGLGFSETHEHESTSALRDIAAAAVATFKSRPTTNLPHPFAAAVRPQSMGISAPN